ncbi:DUF413 domain-containing protein [Thalassotalea sp. M1531]|uniref:Macrodomain Ori protein n=1 Tax=Thalassotalea algicola TaxID=2716224 RepID=A0A7Y0LDE4_9GAMM|nr:DUF413 domain-containing protein [Thalassotalea algicola]NMP32129.1 DUF413 domain-containing protein [Thalassotalea algicola]
MNTTNISKDSFKANRKFYDDRNYPRGLSRSGDFTLSEVQILETYGIALQELANDKRSPINEDEQRFINVCKGVASPESKIEKAWLKYQNKVLSPKQFHTLFGRTKVEANDDDTATESLDIETD